MKPPFKLLPPNQEQHNEAETGLSKAKARTEESGNEHRVSTEGED